MRKILLGIIPMLLIPLLGVSIDAQETEEIPSWIKVIATAWGDDTLDDTEFKNAMEFLMEKGIIPIDTVQVSDETERLYQLEINQKEDRISILEKEVHDVGLDNSHLLQSIVERGQTITDKNKIITDNEKTIQSLTRHMKIVNDSDVKKIEAAKLELEEKYDNLLQESQKEIDKLKSDQKVLEQSYSECKELMNSYKHIGTDTNYYLEMTEYRDKYQKTLSISNEKDNIIADLTNEIELKNTTIQELEIIIQNQQDKISELEQQE